MSTIAGFDFGTSNCAFGVITDNQPTLVNLPQHGHYLPSTLYAPQPEVISGWLYQQLKSQGLEQPYQQARPNLGASLNALREAKLDGYDDQLAFGVDALDKYLVDPADCYYVRSPKSFLGSSGITPRQQQMFEDICASTMWHLRHQAEQTGLAPIKKVVIGRPVNFQGLDSHRSNTQATEVLTRAAKFAGFDQVEFLYEPIAAGLSYQQQLQQQQNVLVVDIGGGTSDISMLQMAAGSDLSERHDEWVLGYSGERIGGNDFDIALNFNCLMPTLGSRLKDGKGRPIPNKPFIDAASVNNISDQTRFYRNDTRAMLSELQRQPELTTLMRILTLQQQHMTFQLSACAERAKIALSELEQAKVALDFLEPELATVVDRANFTEAAQQLLKRMSVLIDDVIAQSSCKPDVLFLTGGSANAPFIKDYLWQRYQIPMVSADNFGSVTSGLTLWADKIFNKSGC
ncbi:molecular chaperone [Ferrimonas lipolytica]|uniref:Molecular chaperone n=1 Tax=Ferrimonas lipolytica TaxID=2724191 RepID=A0A6H1UBF4_9GAMM|nr:molecular chaperone [Ferrimonas lipolytica]QIZ76168.1 molecular chaperone [Ferrimonas lipolytica]